MRQTNKDKSIKKEKNIVSSEVRKKHGFKRRSLINYKLRQFLTYFTMFFVVSFLCLLASSTLLFKINLIEVQGDEVCDAQALIEKSGIKTGDNLFFIKKDEVKSKLEKEIPIIEDVTIKKRIPSKVIINIKKANKIFDVEYENNHIYTNEKGKVLEVSSERDDNLILLRGIGVKSFSTGEKILYVDESMSSKISEILNQMNAKELDKIKGIDFSDELNIMIDYDKRIKMNFGMYERIDYKIRTAAELLNNKIGKGESGILDLSVVSKENRSYFTPIY